MDRIKSGWFSETNELWAGQAFCMEVDEILHDGKSAYQDIMVLQTKSHGRALILDGIIQCTEHDEFSYQEMISFLPLCVHDNPAKVLIVGGGDGGVAREVSKHPLVSEIVQVEIDSEVIEISKKYLPFMAVGFESPKLSLHVCDGFEYIRNHKNEFDVIITDSSDPVGPAVNLFTGPYFELVKQALKPGGVACSQAGNIWIDLDDIKNMMEHCSKHFDVVKYAMVNVPTYPTGQIGFIVASTTPGHDLAVPKMKFSDGNLQEMNLRYYNSGIHTAAFTLPNFAAKVLK